MSNVFVVGVLVAFDAVNWLATVDLRGGAPFRSASGIPVNRGLTAAEMVAGRYVCVWFPIGGAAAEAVVLGVWV